jgi:rhamnosyltransferase subunit B
VPLPIRTYTNNAGGKTILFGWELGAGFGHVRPLLALARDLTTDGHRPVFAVRDPVGAWPALRDHDFPILPAPNWRHPGDPVAPASYADVLGAHGYASADTLAPLVRAWDGILDAIRPALVVLDYAPTLGLAAAGRVPALDVGNAFCQPPRHLSAFPVLFPDRPPTFADADLLAAVQAVQRARAAPVPGTLPEVLAWPERCVASFPELDPYRDVRAESSVGPLEPLPPPLPLPAAPRFFAYLVADVTSTEPALRILAASELVGEAFIRGADDGLKTRLRAAGVTVHDRLAAPEEAFARSGAVVHQGGLMTAHAALAAGRPQLLLPVHGEHLLNAVALHRLGVAHYLTGEYPAADVVEAVRQLLHDPAFARRAAELATHFHHVGLCDGLSFAVGRCRDMLNR